MYLIQSIPKKKKGFNEGQLTVIAVKLVEALNNVNNPDYGTLENYIIIPVPDSKFRFRVLLCEKALLEVCKRLNIKVVED